MEKNRANASLTLCLGIASALFVFVWNISAQNQQAPVTTRTLLHSGETRHPGVSGGCAEELIERGTYLRNKRCFFGCGCDDGFSVLSMAFRASGAMTR